jgi:hypothetical protein
MAPTPHPRLEHLRSHNPPTAHQVRRDRAGGSKVKAFNSRVALGITASVGTMWCAYIFAVIGIMGVTGALTGNVGLVLVVGAISGYFLQLFLLPVIIVGQNVQAAASDARAIATYENAVAILEEAHTIQKHLETQDAAVSALLDKLLAIEKPLLSKVTNA